MRAFFFRAAATVSWALIGVLTARALSVEDRGVYAGFVLALAITGGAVGGGLGSGAGHLVVARKVDPAAALAGGLFPGLILAAAAMAVSAALVVAGLAPTELLVAAAGMLPAVARGPLGSVFLARGRLARHSAGAYGPAYFATLTIPLAFVVFGRSATAALTGWVVAEYVAATLLSIAAGRWWRALRNPGALATARSVTAFGITSGLASSASFANQRADFFMVAALEGEHGAGLYSVSVSGAETLLAFAAAFAVAAYARAASAGVNAPELWAAAVRKAVASSAVVGLGIALSAPLLVPAVLGARYREAIPALELLVCATVLLAPQQVFSSFFLVQAGKPRITLVIRTGSAIFDIALCVVLVPPLGIAGAAIASVLSYGAGTAVYAALFLRATQLRHSDIWRLRRSDVAIGGLRLPRRQRDPSKPATAYTPPS